MSVDEINSYVLLFPNDEWTTGYAETELRSAVAQLQPSVSFAQNLQSNIETLSAQRINRGSVVSGLLYVPDIDKKHHCHNISTAYVPHNVTRIANLPPTDFTLIAIAPWISAQCTRAYLDSACRNPTRGFIFYLPDNDTARPPSSSSHVWSLHDGNWKDEYPYPVFAVPGNAGGQMMLELSLYSGNMTQAPFGHEISEAPGIDPRDYVRIYTDIYVSGSSTFPSIWVFLLVVVTVLGVMLVLISATMHLIQRRRRQSLRRRVINGEVNLEALGIKRLTVPQLYIDQLPLFIYNTDNEKAETTPPISPTSPGHKKPHNTTLVERRDSSEYAQTNPGLQPPIDSNPQSLTIIADASFSPDYMFFHKFLPYSQPTCPICLEDFEPGVTEIRELTCGHIFHPECIDTFLGNNSSLCPMCKKSALPTGYCPAKITNAIVRREMNIRKLRSRVRVNERTGALETLNIPVGFKEWVTNIGRAILGTSNGQREPQIENPIPLRQPQTVSTIPPCPPAALLSNEVPEDNDAPMARQDLVQQRIQELAAEQASIQDPDVAARPRSKWRENLSKAFPGFS